MSRRWIAGFALCTISIPLFAGCNSTTSDAPSPLSNNANKTQVPSDGSGEIETNELFWKKRTTPSPSPTPAATATPTSTPAPSPTPSGTPSSLPVAMTDALVYNGAGTSPTDTTALVSILQSKGLTYKVVDSPQLNAMTLTQMTAYKTFVWPGGDSNIMSDSLTGSTRLRIFQAVTQYGVSYSGFCAGAWMAVGPNPGTRTPIWGLAILPGDYLKPYYPNGEFPLAAMVSVMFSNGSTRDLVWWGGPILPNIAGGIVGKYPEGSPAIVQSWAGKGYVSITGLHPEAPQTWRTSGNLYDTDGMDSDIAWNMIESAWKKAPLPAF